MPEKAAICVSIPARIHCGLINESGTYGRVDGGIGFALERPRWIIEVSLRECLAVQQSHDELMHAANVARTGFGDVLRGRDISIVATMRVPAHVGLGSKTALLMGIGHAICALANVEMDDHEIAARVQRGGTSGIGIHAALHGGFIWDAGHRFVDKGTFGPSSARLATPARALARYECNWLHVVHFRFSPEGIHGTQERDLFSHICPVDANESLRMLQAVAWGVAPAILEHDEPRLQAALSEIQSLGFKRHEWDVQDDTTKSFRKYWETSRPREALGISSVGPTLYTLTTRPDTIVELIRGFGHEPIHCDVVGIDNSGIRTTSS